MFTWYMLISRTNVDKTGLLWKCLQQRTHVSSREKSAPGFKKSELKDLN